MLARMVRREREVAIRAALGASRLRLLRQLLTESTLLALAGGALGLGLAALGRCSARRRSPNGSHRAPRKSRSTSTVLLFTFIVSVATGLVFGSVPALERIARRSRRRCAPAAARRRAAPDACATRSSSSRSAASFMLLIGAGLTLRSLVKLQQVDPGFTTDNILTLADRSQFHEVHRRRRQARALLAPRLRGAQTAVPGVASVGGAGTFPLNEQAPFSQSLLIRGREDAMKRRPHPTLDVRLATPNYFETIGQPVVSGRTSGWMSQQTAGEQEARPTRPASAA